MVQVRYAAIARGLVLLALLALLPLIAVLRAPSPAAAQSAVPDSLWAGEGSSVGVCASPSAAASLADCFSSATFTASGLTIHAATTDGVNVYYAGQGGGLSCPIADLGANCSRIMAGPWPQKYGGNNTNTVNAMAAYEGTIWIGQEDGQIIRCPADLAYVSQDTMPVGCEKLDDASPRGIFSLLLANGRLYAGLNFYGAEQNKQGILWNCDPQEVNACENFDAYGEVEATTLAVGAGYLWAGLGNGIIWRCDLDTTNACANWDTAGNQVNSISYDGQGTLYAAIQGGSAGVVWSCPTATQNSCSTVIDNVDGQSVAAGAGGVFSSAGGKLRFNTSEFTAASSTFWPSRLLYLPAEGPAGVGAADVTVSAGKWTRKLDHRCGHRDRNPKASVVLRGPSGYSKRQKIALCDLRDAASVTRTFHLLDPGEYTVTARTKKYGGSESFTVDRDRTEVVGLRLTRKEASK